MKSYDKNLYSILHQSICSSIVQLANFRDLSTEVSVLYTSGEWSGTLASDMISVISSQGASPPTEAYVALIESSKDFFIRGAEWEGIMGMAYPALAKV